MNLGLVSILILIGVFATELKASELPLCPAEKDAFKHQCHGVVKYKSGSKYDGEWVDNKRHGQGTYYYAKGNKYIGSWLDGKRNGRGTFMFANGDQYVGDFQNSAFHGNAIFTFASSGNKYVLQTERVNLMLQQRLF